MRRVLSLYATSIGKKYVMAVTGIVLCLWLILHAVGNLKVFTGAQHFNEYGEFLRVIGAPVLGDSLLLWGVRALLLACLILHVVATVQLWRQDAASRQVRYRKYEPQVFSWASRTMRWGGIIVFLFVVFHILHLTTGTVHPDFIAADPYHNIVLGLAVVPVALFYVLAVCFLGLHLYHGIWSSFQTLGLNNTRYNAARRPLALAVSLAVSVSFLSIPLAVLAGILR
ncbi:succinate dehydrogenase cytochrome b subunit [soil metagenome]